MRLAAAGDSLSQAVHAELDRRLDPGSGAPLAVALSGGGDSLALLLIASDWARRAGRPLLALTVDHRLQPQSAAWAEACAAIAARTGASFRALAWEGSKPRTGLPAAARAARHALLADAARAAGARVILMGHTADDRLEAAAMRAAGSTTPDPRAWTPSPAWPQGRGLFLLRPLIDLRRAALRDWLRARGESWIDDPANDDAGSARARARLAGVGGSPPPQPARPVLLARACSAEIGGGLAVPRRALREAAPDDLQRFLAVAAVCAGGGTRRPAAASLQRAARLLASGEDCTMALAGARIEANAHEVHILREAGEAARGGLAPLRLADGEAAVWDGRFEITARRAVEVRPLAGLARRLPDDQRRGLMALPARSRGGLPAVVSAKGMECPVLAPVDGVALRDLVHDRLIAAAGIIEREPG